jgi:hypothetical protein
MQNERKLDDIFEDQKEAYDEMLHVTSTDQIIGYITEREEEKKRKKKIWKKAPFVAGFAAVLLSGVLMVSTLDLPFGNNSSSRSDSSSHNEMSSSKENSATDHAESSGGRANPNALQAKDVKSPPGQNTLSMIKEMDASGAPLAEIDEVFLDMLTQKEQRLDSYKSEWQNTYKQNFYTLVGGSEEERLNVLHNIERLKEAPELQNYVKSVFQDGLSFEIAGNDTGIVPIIDYKALIENFSPYLSSEVIKYLKDMAERNDEDS